MQRFKPALTTGHWGNNQEPLVRDDKGEFVLYEDVKLIEKALKYMVSLYLVADDYLESVEERDLYAGKAMKRLLDRIKD